MFLFIVFLVKAVLMLNSCMLDTHNAKTEISVVQLEQVYTDALMMFWMVDVG